VNHYRESPPAIFHGASFFMNGIAAVYAARKLGVKSVYELRGLQELSKISRHPYWGGSEHYQYYERLETQAALDADAVFAITQALKDEFIRRGVPSEKITVLPNGVHSEKFEPKEKDAQLLGRNGLTTETIIGFAGSFVDYEGLDILVEAVRILTSRGRNNFRLLLVGDGTYIDVVKSLVNEYGLEDYVTFTGRVPHEEVEDYYSIFDICPLPRKGLPVCEMISPLKPFEAMAMGKTVVSSDVATLAEIVQDGVTGLLHKKDDAVDLADKLELLIDDPELNKRLGKAAREWVVAERDWKIIAKRVDEVYKKLLNS
ncbi:glycosyltransferase family 4 protein, partial [Vibrio parahaemolyticus]